MSKKMIFLALIGMIGVLGYVQTNSYAMDPMIKGLDRPYEISRLFGTHVKNAEGDYLGRIDDFIVDRNGIAFAVVSHGGFVGFGGKQIAVPLSACSFDNEGHYFVLNVNKERFASAPAYTSGSNLADRAWAEDTYRFFGLQPYWTESEGGMMDSGAIEPMEKESAYPEWPTW
jgi:hypothetical protein